MARSLLVINGKAYSKEDLLSAEGTAPKESFESSLLSFYRNWLAGQPEFTLQTSGSTGAPKSIVFRREQLVQSARSTNKALQFTAGMTGLLCLQPSYVAGMMMCVRCLEARATMLAVEPSSNPLAGISEPDQIDLAAMVPLQVHAVLRSKDRDKLNFIRTLLIGGARVDSSLRSMLSGVRTRCYATFGMTETLTHIALQLLNGPEARDTFQALPDVQLGTDERGCLTVRAPYLDETVMTNDLVELKNANEFRWLGRIDQVINSGGIKLYPEILEDRIAPILSEAGIQRKFFVAAQPDAALGQVAWLFLEGMPPSSDESDKILHSIKSRLDRYQVPKGISSIGEFVETASGKIDRMETIRLLEKEGPAGSP